MKECPKCHTMIEDDAVFCGVCGTKQEIEEVEAQPEEQSSQEEQFCIHCGKSIEAGSLFCPYCGKPQDVEETKSEEPQPKAEKPEPEQEEPQPEEPQVKEKPQVEESPKEEPKPEETQQEVSQPEEEPTYEVEEEKKSRTWVRILLALLLLGVLGGGYYYFMIYKTDAPETENNDVTITSTQEETIKTTLPTDPKEFLESMYKDFYEPWNKEREEKAYLSKYFTKEAMRIFYVMSDYREVDEAPFYYYCTDFLVYGEISGNALPDYGDRVVYRTIEPENDGWFIVTNIWDVIKDPVIVHLQVKSVDGALKIVDISVDNNFTDNSAKERISFEEAISVTQEMIIKDGSFIGFQLPEKVESIMAKYGYKKEKRYYVYRAFDFTPLYYKNCSFKANTEEDFAYSEVPSAGKEGTPSFVGFDNTRVVIAPFTKEALNEYVNQIRESGASLIEEKDDGYKNFKLGEFEISVFTNIAWGLKYCIMISKEEFDEAAATDALAKRNIEAYGLNE